MAIIHTEPHPMAGTEQHLKDGSIFRVEDWADRVFGSSVWEMNGNPACLTYVARLVIERFPIDNETLTARSAARVP